MRDYKYFNDFLIKNYFFFSKKTILKSLFTKQSAIYLNVILLNYKELYSIQLHYFYAIVTESM